MSEERDLVCSACHDADHADCSNFVFVPYRYDPQHLDRFDMIPYVCRCECATIEANKQRFFARTGP
jgi:hypothetical protein